MIFNITMWWWSSSSLSPLFILSPLQWKVRQAKSWAASFRPPSPSPSSISAPTSSSSSSWLFSPVHHHHHDQGKSTDGQLGCWLPTSGGPPPWNSQLLYFSFASKWAHHLHHLYHCHQRVHQLHHHHHHHHRQKVQTANWLPTAMATQFLALYFSFRRHTHLPVFIVFNPKLSSLDFWQNHGLLWGLQEPQRIVGI